MAQGPELLVDLQLASLFLRSGGVLRLWWDGGAHQSDGYWRPGMLIEGSPRVSVACAVPIEEIMAIDPDSPPPPGVPEFEALTADARWAFGMELPDE